MTQTADLSPRLIEALYCEALLLSDEVRAALGLSADLVLVAPANDAGRLALSCEALRTTTRMMHAVAWLLNHRAYFLGELSEFQLQRYGRLAPDCPPADPARLRFFAPPLASLIAATESFYARLLRIDRFWRAPPLRDTPACAIERLRERLGQARWQAGAA